MTQVETVEPTKLTLSRHLDASFLNIVVNHPDVRPFVCGPLEGDIDMSAFAENPNNVLLMGEYGGVMFHKLQPGLYEAHTQVLPEGRGEWTLSMVRRALFWMFTRTDAVELLTRCPQGNTPAKVLAKAIGGEFEFTRPNAWVMNGISVPADIYSLSVQKWMRTADNLTIRGRWVDNKIKKEFKKQGVKNVSFISDENHDRYTGAAIEMIMSGQIGKGVALFNRWAAVAGYAQARVVSEAPLTIDFRGIIMVFRNNDFWVVPCQ